MEGQRCSGLILVRGCERGPGLLCAARIQPQTRRSGASFPGAAVPFLRLNWEISRGKPTFLSRVPSSPRRSSEGPVQPKPESSLWEQLGRARGPPLLPRHAEHPSASLLTSAEPLVCQRTPLGKRQRTDRGALRRGGLWAGCVGSPATPTLSTPVNASAPPCLSVANNKAQGEHHLCPISQIRLSPVHPSLACSPAADCSQPASAIDLLTQAGAGRFREAAPHRNAFQK